MSAPLRKPGREHIPLLPKGFIVLRVLQLVVAVIVLGLAAYSINYWAADENILMLAVAIITIISSVYHLVAWFGAPDVYNYWAILGLDIVLVVLWLCAFAVLAARIAPLMKLMGGALYAWGTREDQAFWTGLAAASGMGGLEFVLHLVSLIIHSVQLHRHRKEGGHCQPGVPWGPKVTPGTVAVPQGQQQQQQQQPVYAAQPVQQVYQQQPVYHQQQPQQQVYQQQPAQGQQQQQVYVPQPQYPQHPQQPVVYQQ
ncbi:membrane-associating domain-containing protein [Triangularia verruculosa]|uniref:Membrane-associating domain-containing protein n=1 Tax=Triangularia verruculosa TaxID=2587418 RepID=A0AAN6XJY6_9PEZI|nr:membrane-associating domain-containing protein [Triangularia verruculosa]